MNDVIIAGGGIAGASLAILLARQGLQVKVFDRARFPREKPCGEGLMPAGVEALARLGVEIEGAPFQGVRYCYDPRSVPLADARGSMNRDRKGAEIAVEGRFPGGAHGLAVRRKELDNALLRCAARQPGVHVITDCRVEAPLIEDGRITGVLASGVAERARLTVGADGANSLLRHKLGWDASSPSRRFGVRVHYKVARQLENWVDVYLERGREIYVTPLPQRELLVATLSESKEAATRFPFPLNELLEDARPIDEPLGAAPLNVRASRRHADGVVLIGDAAGNCDPITGGGMTQALLSSELLAARLARAFPPKEQDLAAFDAERERMLRDYRRLTSMVLALAKRPSLILPTLDVLRAWPALFSHLIGVAGGVRPLFAWPGKHSSMTRREWWLVCAGAILRAETPQTSLVSGFRNLYHLRFADGRRAFQSWQTQHPQDPMGFAAEAASLLFEEFERHGVLTVEFFLDDRTLLGGITGTADSARTGAFEKSNTRARELAEGVLKSDPQNATALLAATVCAGLRADYASLIEKRQVESLRQIRAADSYANRLLAVDSRMGDGYMALGAASYILACLPAYKRAVLWFGRLQGDKQRGMDQLARAAKDGLYLAPYAKMLLSLAMLREHRAAEAKRLIRELVAEFPESPLFARERVKIDRM